MRRVHVEQGEDVRMHQKDFKEDLPILPIFLPPSEVTSFLFEFHDIHDKATELDLAYDTKIVVTYDGDQKAIGHFDYKIENEFYLKSRGNVLWQIVKEYDGPEWAV